MSVMRVAGTTFSAFVERAHRRIVAGECSAVAGTYVSRPALSDDAVEDLVVLPQSVAGTYPSRPSSSALPGRIP